MTTHTHGERVNDGRLGRALRAAKVGLNGTKGALLNSVCITTRTAVLSRKLELACVYQIRAFAPMQKNTFSTLSLYGKQRPHLSDRIVHVGIQAVTTMENGVSVTDD